QIASRKTVWTGPATAGARDAETEGAPYQAIRPSDVTSALLPRPLAPGASDTVLLDGDRESFTLTLAAPEGGRGLARRRVTVDRDTLRPRRLRQYDDKGDLETDVTLSTWAEDQPHAVAISRPLEGYGAKLRLSRSERNVSVPEQAFTPRTPAGYSVVEVR